MNKVYVDEVIDVSTNEVKYYEVKEDFKALTMYSTPFYLRMKNKDDALLLRKLINDNIDYSYSATLYNKKLV